MYVQVHLLRNIPSPISGLIPSNGQSLRNVLSPPPDTEGTLMLLLASDWSLIHYTASDWLKV